MARLRDLKVGQTVWIKRGTTSMDDFSLNEKEISLWIGQSGEVADLDPNDGTFTVRVESQIPHLNDWWWPVDWISLTPPKEDKKAKETKKTVEQPEEFIVLLKDSSTYGPATLESLLSEMTGDGYDEDDISRASFYSARQVSVKLSPAKLELL